MQTQSRISLALLKNMKLGWSQHRTETESEDLGFGLRLSKREKYTHWPHHCYRARQPYVYESKQGTHVFTGENIKARCGLNWATAADLCGKKRIKETLPLITRQLKLRLRVKLKEFISRPYPQLYNTGLLCCFSKIWVSFKPNTNTFSVKLLPSVCAIYTLTKSFLPPDNGPAVRLKGAMCRIYWILLVRYCTGNMYGFLKLCNCTKNK